MTDIANHPIKVPSSVRAGEPMSARWGNDVATAIRSLTRGARPPRQASPPRPVPGSATFAVTFQAFGSTGDYLVCRDSDGKAVNVALPWEFARSAWDGQTRKNSFDQDVRYTYFADEHWRRTITNLASGSIKTEDIRPRFHSGQPLVAAQVQGGCSWAQVGGKPLELVVVRNMTWGLF